MTQVISNNSLGFMAVQNKSGAWFCRWEYNDFYGVKMSKWTAIEYIKVFADSTISVKPIGKDLFCQCVFASSDKAYRVPSTASCTSIEYPLDGLYIEDKYNDSIGVFECAYLWVGGELINSGGNAYDQHVCFRDMAANDVIAYISKR